MTNFYDTKIKAKELGIIQSFDCKYDLKNKAIIGSCLSAIGIVNADLTDCHRLLGALFGKSFSQMKSIYEKQFDQYQRLHGKVKNAIKHA